MNSKYLNTLARQKILRIKQGLPYKKECPFFISIFFPAFFTCRDRKTLCLHCIACHLSHKLHPFYSTELLEIAQHLIIHSFLSFLAKKNYVNSTIRSPS